MVMYGFQHLQSDFTLATSSSLEPEELRFHGMSPKPGRFSCMSETTYCKPATISMYMLTGVPADTEANSFSAREMSNVECFPPSESRQPAAPKLQINEGQAPTKLKGG